MLPRSFRLFSLALTIIAALAADTARTGGAAIDVTPIRPLPIAALFEANIASTAEQNNTPKIALYEDGRLILRRDETGKPSTFWTRVLEPEELSEFKDRLTLAALSVGEAENAPFEPSDYHSHTIFYFDPAGLGVGSVLPISGLWLPKDEITAPRSDNDHVSMEIPRELDEYHLFLATWTTEGMQRWEPLASKKSGLARFAFADVSAIHVTPWMEAMNPTLPFFTRSYPSKTQTKAYDPWSGIIAETRNAFPRPQMQVEHLPFQPLVVTFGPVN